MAKRIESRKIEKAAVAAVDNLVQPCDTIDPKIPVDDKNVLVDGTLDLYSSPKLVKENLIDQIPVQVKGTVSGLTVNKRGFAKYKVRVADLRGYLDVFHGVLFFCVAVDKDALIGTDVYYSQLLPYDINKVLGELKPSQKTVMLPFRRFPTEPKDIKRLLTAFHADKEEQLKATVSGYGFLDKNKSLPSDIVSFSFATQLYPDESPVSLAGLRNGAYIYGTTNKGRAVVFGKLDNVKMFGINSVRTVSSGDFEINTDVVSGECEDGYYLEFEGVHMVMNDRKVRVDYTISKGFRRRYRTIRIMEEFLRTGELYLDGHRLLSTSLDGAGAEEKEEAIEKLEEQKKAYRSFIETIEAVGVGDDVDWEPSKLSAKEFRNLETLHQAFVEKKSLNNSAIKPPIVRFEIQGTSIFAIVNQRDDGAFDFINLMSDETFFVFGTPNEGAENPKLGFNPVPAAVVIGKRGFKTIANLDPARFLAQLERYPVTEANQEPLNQKLLEMLAAYDEGAVQPRELLACAAALASSLHEFDPESSAYHINLLQTTMRERGLKDEEKEELKNLVVDASDSKTKAAACALLGDTDMANRYLDKCTPMERKELIDFPISRYFKEEEDHTADNPVLPEE